MSKGTPIRSVRVPDDLWNAALQRATETGQTITDVLVTALREFVTPPPPQS